MKASTEIVLKAMEDGLAGQKLPDFGSRLPLDLIEMINAVYEAARNRAAGDDAADESMAWLPSAPLPTLDASLLPTKEEA
jgi:hypothetical protein